MPDSWVHKAVELGESGVVRGKTAGNEKGRQEGGAEEGAGGAGLEPVRERADERGPAGVLLAG